MATSYCGGTIHALDKETEPFSTLEVYVPAMTQDTLYVQMTTMLFTFTLLQFSKIM